MTDFTLDLATVLYDQRVDGYLHLTGTVLLVYDHLLTLESEVRNIWAPGNIRAVAWYFLVRYFALCANLAMFPLAFGNFSTKLLTLSLRVLAIYSVARRGKYFVAAVAIIVISLGAWTVKDVSPVLASPGCYSGTPTHRQLQIAGLWEAMFATDVVFLGLTLYRGYTQSRLLGTGFPPGSLWHVIVRDGGIICIANLTNIIIYYSSNINAGLSSFTAAFSVTAASRLMLNLREVASADDLTSAASGSIHFVGGTGPIDATDSAT
ncbi:hypothetical protein DFH07DRAFT_859928 [Mycena maculata]|uniref:DUF6533 domain-containing protein n=1 Tax=Mycena maculata TaxID=230809 RepID=A0AAD7HEY7_9AGAR|nr:hypothetical protein DFH07DRAFT_859928 [Mycena maculata]